MIGASTRSKLVFTILLHRHSPEEFLKIREQRFERMYLKTHGLRRHREEFDASYPAIHRYNDIAGYAELYWDGGTRILAELFVQGDRRRKHVDENTGKQSQPGKELRPFRRIGFIRCTPHMLRRAESAIHDDPAKQTGGKRSKRAFSGFVPRQPSWAAMLI